MKAERSLVPLDMKVIKVEVKLMEEIDKVRGRNKYILSMMEISVHGGIYIIFIFIYILFPILLTGNSFDFGHHQDDK